MSQIKTICPVKHGGCGREHFLEVPDDLDEDARSCALTFAKMTGCRPCSIWQVNRQALEDVQNENQRTIWEQERNRQNLERLIERKPNNVAALKDKINTVDRITNIARGDLVDAVRQITQLDDARADYLEKL